MTYQNKKLGVPAMESGARVLRKLVWSELKGDLAIWRYPRSVLLLNAAGSLAVLAVFKR